MEAFNPSNSLIAGLEQWQWASTRSKALSVELVKAVAAAERAVSAAELRAPTDAGGAELQRQARAQWEQANALGERLRKTEQAPHPTVVEDALARTDAAVSRLGLQAPGA